MHKSQYILKILKNASKPVCDYVFVKSMHFQCRHGVVLHLHCKA